MPNKKQTKGERAELIAAEYFMDLGYLVARNMSSNGTVDLVLVDEDCTGGIILVDVKAISVRAKNKWKIARILSQKQKKLKVQLIFVDLDTKEVSTDMPHASNKRLDLN
jgi:Holliday junction resolvase-like predicted endonuclease